MSLPESIWTAWAKHRATGYERPGQAAFNAVHDVYPEVANELRGGEFDPFYQNHRLLDFLEQVSIRLEGEA